ncbi:uncharacterized protein LOC123670068 [Melitaea cinxia]|uniref:uncharacterized protein LOC123670068 n=1 Tax=Melitaea cinxia TaxID=113334 RepID=UPI001E271F58|nr:uncharacterized protein LOC123670068 [Melitaea cinxia]
MNNKELLQEYSESIRSLKKECAKAGISDEEFKEMYFESIKDVDNLVNENQSFLKKYKFIITCFFIVLFVAYNFKSIYSCFLCNVQEYIYPGYRLLRKISIPFLSLFPSLTDLYQETCLIQNPFFTVVDMDCWPCSSVNNIGEVFNPQPVHKQQIAPFIYKTDQPEIDINALKTLYIKNKDVFDSENSKVLTNNKYYQTPKDIFDSEILKEQLYIWKLNHFNAARTLRQIIARPKIVPKFGQSTERFIIIDSKHDTFHIPDTECNFTFLLVLSGTRIIDLQPAEECKYQCKSFKMELKKSYLLWYNWWYWRPTVPASRSNETFIAHVGSYC